MELQTSHQAAIIAPVGTKITDRRLNAVSIATSGAALAAIAARGGKVGKAAAERNLGAALVDMAHHCASSNYRPLAEYLAATTGKTTVVDRHVFHALPSLFKAEMEDLESRGKAVSAATGKASAAYVQALTLHKLASDLVAASEQIRAERKAKQDAERAEKSLEVDPTTAAIMAELERIDAEVAGE